MKASQIHRLAALDNARLCAAMWRAHGLAVERGAGLLACAGTPPRFYPHVVTIDPQADDQSQMDEIAERAALTPGPFFVKDSFRALPLERLGFEPQFEARWIHRAASAAAGATRLSWREVSDAAALSDWETAWKGGEDQPPLFLPAFLADPTVTLLAGWADGAIAAGCVVTTGTEAAGISNGFGDAAEAINAAAATFADRDLVGYESDDALATALDAGFEAVGELVVWRLEAAGV
jgi:hypothetical protein